MWFSKFCVIWILVARSDVISAGSLSWWDSLIGCHFYECCGKSYLKANVKELSRLLRDHLYGQHIVQETLVHAIGAHLNNKEFSRKPLVISFHGTPGTGKNYVTEFVASALYRKGMGSEFVNKFTANDKERDLAAIVMETVKMCPQSLFIFDEIEKLPKKAFEKIVSLLDHHSSMKEYDFSKAIFIFLSNSGGDKIAEELKSFIDKGGWRDNTKLTDFEGIAQSEAYLVIKSFYHGGVLDSYVIDHFIPFLPLELRHVEQCIKTEYEAFCTHGPKPEDIDEIIESAVTKDDSGMFSNNGCKRISKKVESLCYKQNKLKRQKKEL